MNIYSKKPSRRFIAAARCPNCGEQDILYFVGEIGEDFACVECGYQSASGSSNGSPNNKASIKDNKLNGVSSQAAKQETMAQPIKIIESKPKSN